MKCDLCGRDCKTKINKWFEYDNGERERFGICVLCYEMTSSVDREVKQNG